MIELLQQWWHMVAACFAAVVYVVRNEANTRKNTQDIKEIRQQIREDRDQIREMFQEIRGDIKQLMMMRHDK